MDQQAGPYKSHSQFDWQSLGDIAQGRQNLGSEMPVLVYRLMQYTLLDILSQDFGQEKANDYLRHSGYLAGSQFAVNILDLTLPVNGFFAHLQEQLRDLKIGILRIESFDQASGDIILTVEEDLDCSGLPITDESVCSYDEGFIAGILDSYTGKSYSVNEIDCWARGQRVCRFEGKVNSN